MVQQRLRSWLIGLAVGCAALAAPDGALAQGCSMCYTTAAAAKAAAIQALRSGILILLIPPVLITLGIFALALHRRDRFNDGYPEEPQVDRELSEWLARMSREGVDVSRASRRAPADSRNDEAAMIAAIPRSNS